MKWIQGAEPGSAVEKGRIGNDAGFSMSYVQARIVAGSGAVNGTG
jgi:hypothetical protein